jgi:hypothetical protein
VVPQPLRRLTTRRVELGGPPVPGPPLGGIDGTANTNVIGHAGRTYAIVEAGAPPVELTDELETVRRTDLDGTLEPRLQRPPHRDPLTGELHAVTYYWGWDHLRHIVVGTDGRVRRSVDVEVPGKPMVHDCAITESQVVLFDLPSRSTSTRPWPRGLPVPLEPRLRGPGGRAAPQRRGRRRALVRGGAVLRVPPAQRLRPAATGRVVLDVVRHPKMFASDVHGPERGRAPASTAGPSTRPPGGDQGDPRRPGPGVPPPRRADPGRRHRYGVRGLVRRPRSSTGPGLKHDLDAAPPRSTTTGPAGLTLEPVFVPRATTPPRTTAGCCPYVYDATDRSSDVVLDAQDFTGEPVAVVHLPQPGPVRLPRQLGARRDLIRPDGVSESCHG